MWNIKRIKYLQEDEPFCLRRLTGEFINYKLSTKKFYLDNSFFFYGRRSSQTKELK